LSATDAVELLSSALSKSGYALLRNGRILTIASRENNRTADLAVVVGNNPQEVAKSDEAEIRLIPVRYVNASQLVGNLNVLLPPSASLSVNESANALILVATKTDVRRMLKIISALDSSMAAASTCMVLQLHHADAKLLAVSLQQIFSSPASSQSAASMFLPGPGGFGPPGAPGTPGGAADADNSSSSPAQAKVTVVADELSNSLIVNAPAGPLATITRIAQQVDHPVFDITEFRVFHLANADAAETADQVTQLFPLASNNGGDQNFPPVFFDGGPGGGPPGAGTDPTASNNSDRANKQSQVLAVADSRTSSLLVSAPSRLMPQIAKLIGRLDASAGRKEIFTMYELRNADPQDVNQALAQLFNRNNTQSANNNNINPLLGQNNPLTVRQTQQSSSGSQTSSGFGSSGSRSSGGSMGGQGNASGGL
jgi:general secretion pathway protein D